jgi:hypothetical protein
MYFFVIINGNKKYCIEQENITLMPIAHFFTMFEMRKGVKVAGNCRIYYRLKTAESCLFYNFVRNS